MQKVVESVSIPIIGIGAGSDVDGQVLVLHDMIGMTHEFNPRFLRRYLNLFEDITGAVKNYISDVKSKDFPNEKRTILMLEVLYEDNHLIAVNKKSGDIVQGDKTGDTPLSDFVKFTSKKYKKSGEVFLGIIHRLDRPTSGIVLFARTSKALSRMNEQFRKKEVKKTY